MSAGILLVDDRPENLKALEAILEPFGERLLYAQSGDEALKHLLHEEVAVILLDVQMPGIDGFETAELIKQRERTRHIPIIFLTAISKDAEHVFRGYSAGAVDYMLKPFAPEVLRAKVAVFIELHEKNEQIRRQAEFLRERELADLARVEEKRYRDLAESMPQIVWTATADGRLDYLNQGWFDYTGLPPTELDGEAWESVIHPDDRLRTLERWQRAVADGSRYEIEARYRRGADGAYRWHLGRALPTRGEDGEINGWVGTNTDIEDQKRIEVAQRFLVEAGALLGSSLDYPGTLASLAELAVERIADWCSVDLVEDGELRQLGIAHAEPPQVALLLELRGRYPPAGDSSVLARVVSSGRAELVEEVDEPLLEAVAVDELHLGLLRELGIVSYLAAPITARGRTLGAITLVSGESGRRFDAADLVLAEELGRRAGAAVDNARLYREAEARAQAARVLASIGDGVILLDRNGVVRLWNPAAEAITGLAAADVTGRRAAEAIGGWAEIADRVPVAASVPAGGGRAETLPLAIDGRELWLSVSGIEFDDGTVYAFRDLTEERAVEEMKTDFVATVSHEVRTPLAAIYGAAMTLRRSDQKIPPESQDRLLTVIADEADRLARIVNEILLASHLDSGELALTSEDFDPAELAAGVVEAARVRLPPNVTLDLAARDRLPRVATDGDKVRQVLVNLVENAIKYSPDGGHVELAIEQADGQLRFSIHDEGLGVPPQEHRRIFGKFYRLDPDLTRGVGGTGLGLYICQELVRLLGGRIWVEPRTGKGSTFSFELPLSAPEGGKAGRRRRALVGD